MNWSSSTLGNFVCSFRLHSDFTAIMLVTYFTPFGYKVIAKDFWLFRGCYGLYRRIKFQLFARCVGKLMLSVETTYAIFSDLLLKVICTWGLLLVPNINNDKCYFFSAF